MENKKITSDKNSAFVQKKEKDNRSSNILGFFQKDWSIFIAGVVAMIAGIVAIGGFFGAINDLIPWVNLTSSIIGTIILGSIGFFYTKNIKPKGGDISVDPKKGKYKSRFFFFGMIFAIWLSFFTKIVTANKQPNSPDKMTNPHPASNFMETDVKSSYSLALSSIDNLPVDTLNENIKVDGVIAEIKGSSTLSMGERILFQLRPISNSLNLDWTTIGETQINKNGDWSKTVKLRKACFLDEMYELLVKSQKKEGVFSKLYVIKTPLPKIQIESINGTELSKDVNELDINDQPILQIKGISSNLVPPEIVYVVVKGRDKNGEVVFREEKEVTNKNGQWFVSIEISQSNDYLVYAFFSCQDPGQNEEDKYAIPVRCY